jgi:hypothetical protein
MQEMEAGTTGERGKEMQDQQERETLKDSIRVRLKEEWRVLADSEKQASR